MMGHNIVISGYYGFANAGDEAMLTAIIESLRQLEGDMHITVLTGNPERTTKQHDVRAIGRTQFWKIFQALRQSDLLLSGGGSLLQDVTSARSIYYYLGIILFARLLRKPVVLYAQGIGPVRRRMARYVMRFVLRQVAAIGVRDRQSKVDLLQMGVDKPPIHVTADAVLSISPGNTSFGESVLQAAGCISGKRRIGIALREWKQVEVYKKEIAKAADRLQREEGVEIIFIPMQYPTDVPIAYDIVKEMQTEAYVLDASYATEEFISLMACMDVVIANRLHALIFATLMKIPVVAISYDPKIDGFIHSIGETVCGTVEDVSQQVIITQVQQRLQQKMLLPHVEKQVVHLRRQSFRNLYLVAYVLWGKGRLHTPWQQVKRFL